MGWSIFQGKIKVSIITALIIWIGVSAILTVPVAGQDNQTGADNVSTENNLFLPVILTESTPLIPSLFGVDVSPITVSRGLDEMRLAGANFLRRGPIKWEDIEPEKLVEGEEYQWDAVTSFEQELKNARERGMETILIVGSTPVWARIDDPVLLEYSCSPIKEAEFTAFGDFMFDLVSRYSAPEFNIKYFEMYNEPDIDPRLPPTLDNNTGFGCWGDGSDPYFGGGYYAQMLAAVYPRIKEANPNAKVLVGGLLLDRPSDWGDGTDLNSNSGLFLEGILRKNGDNNGANYFDGISFHGYDYYIGDLLIAHEDTDDPIGKYGNLFWDTWWNTTGPVFIAKAAFIRNLLANEEFGTSDKKFLMNTESAVICAGGETCDENMGSAFELTKAYYLTQSYTAAYAIGLKANVWYSAMGWRGSGLLYPDLTNHNAYDAYVTARAMLVNSRFINELHMYDQVAQYEFIRAGSRNLWVIWSRDGESHPITLPSTPTNIVDALGNPIPVSSNLTIDIKPVYIEWAN